MIIDPAVSRETYIEIRYQPDRSLVAVLELLSRTNKAGIGMGEHLHKRGPIPRIPIPLRPPGPDIVIDLAAVFATTYERGRYRTALRYSQPLTPADREWCEKQAKHTAS